MLNSEVQYEVTPVPSHSHNQLDSPRVDEQNISRFPSAPQSQSIPYWNGNRYTTVSAGTTGYFLTSGGATSAPSYSAGSGPFWGTGSDGSLSLTSGTTTFSLGSTRITIKNYSSISITGTAAVNFTSSHGSGTLLVWKSQGDVTITSSSTPTVDMSNMGGQGGLAVQGVGGGVQVSGLAGNGYGAWEYFNGSITGGTAGNRITPTGGGGGNSMTALTVNGNAISSSNAYLLLWPCVPGAGGGSGANDTFDNTTFSGAGGNGGGGLLILCGGNLNISSSFWAKGQAGGTTTQANNCAGGGGGGGSVVIIYKGTLIANTGTAVVTAGVGGTSNSGGGQNGTAGTDGQFIVAQNMIF